MFVSVALKTLLKGIFLAWVTGILDVQCDMYYIPGPCSKAGQHYPLDTNVNLYNSG